MNKFDQQLVVARKRFRARLLFAGLGILLLLLIAAAINYWTRAVSVNITPQEAALISEMSISNGIGIVIAGKVFSLGRQVDLLIQAKGFYDETPTVDFGSGIRNLSVNMREVPATVEISTIPASSGTQWSLNGERVFVGAKFVQKMLAGTKSFEINHPYFKKESIDIDVERGEFVSLEVQLKPVSRSLSINSVPEQALVEIDGRQYGRTPLKIDSLEGGVHNLSVSLSGYLTATDTIEITNKSNDLVRDFVLSMKMAFVQAKVSPSGGMFTVDGLLVDPSSAFPVTPSQNHILGYEKEGYVSQSRSINLKPDERLDVQFQLEEETGQVVVRSSPESEIILNGKSIGTTPKQLDLQTVPQSLTLKRDGYRAVDVQITPDASAPLLVEKTLQKEFDVLMSEAPPMITNSVGVKMKLFNPANDSKGKFTMGAPRNEKGQRANEILRNVELTKPFFAGTTEITEGQFARFKGNQVAKPDLPIRNVSWIDVVEFCNWLSKKEGLEPVYEIANGWVANFNPQANGYRLLTEAEWEWLARVAGRQKKVRFVWGDETTIPAGSGNLADESGKQVLEKIIPRYKDGYPSVAPVGSFPTDSAGLHDMAGNVSEWVHDVYMLLPSQSAELEVDPFGAPFGSSHVIKGSNFRSASLTEIRSSFREGLDKGKDMVGFRIARYVYGKGR